MRLFRGSPWKVVETQLEPGCRHQALCVAEMFQVIPCGQLALFSVKVLRGGVSESTPTLPPAKLAS